MLSPAVDTPASTRRGAAGQPPRRGVAPWPACAELTGRIARGDEGAFAQFYDLWFERALGLARKFAGRDESVCLDVVQDTMLKVVRGMKRLADDRAVAAWMARAVFTTAMDRQRSESRRRRREQRGAVLETPVPDPHDALASKETRAWLLGEIERFPPQDRALLRARFEEARTLEQVGAAHGLTGNAAHGRIHRMLTRLRHAAREWMRNAQ